MQRDEALAALGDTDRYKGNAERFEGYRRMRWTYDDLVNEAIAEFVLRHHPDAHDWEDGTYSVTSLDGNDGQAYRVEMGIPTSEQDCWLSFEVAIPNLDSDPMALFVHGIRNGIGDNEMTTYVCEGLDGEWVETESEKLALSHTNKQGLATLKSGEPLCIPVFKLMGWQLRRSTPMMKCFHSL